MTLVEGLSIAGLVLGPVSAVLISLYVEERRQGGRRKWEAIRTLLIGRLNVADPSFQLAINTIPVDFRHDENVMAAWEAYMAAVNQLNDPKDAMAMKAAADRSSAAITNLLEKMLISDGYKPRAAGQIARSPYVSGSSAERYKMQQDALMAVVRVAQSTERMAVANETILERMPEPRDELPPNA
jgi:hypothetical protein